MLETTRSSFQPTCTLDDKNLHKTYFRIEEDGTIFERVMLDVPDVRFREELICKHFMRNHVRLFCTDMTGIKVLSRDDPWDFGIELSNNEHFNIEITSIAESSEWFEKLTREERLIRATCEEHIALHKMEKLNFLFPNDEVSTLIAEHRLNKVHKSSSVSNPYFGRKSNLFISNIQPTKEPFHNLIIQAIQKKEEKNHEGKENTILIIDNRTLTYDYNDLHEAVDANSSLYSACSFMEVWFYTGYCSDTDGNNAEFSVVPLKLPLHKWKTLQDLQVGIPQNLNRIVYV